MDYFRIVRDTTKVHKCGATTGRVTSFILNDYAHVAILRAVHVGRIGASPKGNAHLHDLIVEAYMPDLENLKKQAKLILRWHRERDYPVAAQIRGLIPLVS